MRNRSATTVEKKDFGSISAVHANSSTSVVKWESYTTEDGYPYWYNPATGESVWEDPEKKA